MDQQIAVGRPLASNLGGERLAFQALPAKPPPGLGAGGAKPGERTPWIFAPDRTRQQDRQATACPR